MPAARSCAWLLITMAESGKDNPVEARKAAEIMPASELEQYLYDHIPLSRAMQVRHDAVVLSAPLAPNINHRETVFGGSASAIAILAAWSLLHARLRSLNMSSRLVIQRNTMRYELPIAGTFTARSSIPSEAAWASFIRMLRRRGRARIAVSSVLEYAGQPVGQFEGDFVALGAEEAV